MTGRLRLTCVLVGLLGLNAPARAAETSPVVPAFERFFTGENPDLPQGGRLLLGELGCTACHQAGDNQSAQLIRKQAPILDGLGSRVQRGFLRKFLADPHAHKPGTTMPDVLAALPAKDRAEAAEALVHFLASTGQTRQQRPDPKLAKTGQTLYSQVGCAVCHGTRDGAAKQTDSLPHAVPLGDLTGKYTIPSLSAFLAEPHKVRPGARMPGLLDAKEVIPVAHYLLQDASVSLPNPNLAYKYFEGSWEKLPDFTVMKPKSVGQAAGFDLAVASRPNDMGLRFEGYLRLDRAGNYTFHLTSDDGSKLWIDDKLIVDNDGVHAPATKSGGVKLEAGVHKLTVDVFNGGGGAELDVDIEGNGLGKQAVSPLLALTKEGKPVVVDPKRTSSDDENFELEPAKVARGKELFGTLGCASCHQLNIDKQPLASALTAPKLIDLKGNAGCLAERPAGKSPNFHLSAAQRAALMAGVKLVNGPLPAAVADKDSIHHTLLAFNCYACHERDKVGGVEDNRNKLFSTTTPEMGDEGRIPPTLTGVGAKLTPAWLKTLFTTGSHDRPYMHTRMPRFGMDNLGHLVTRFDRLDKIEAVPAPKFAEPLARVKAEGRHLVGDKAFGCIKCHTFNGIKAEGIQAMDLAVMTQRLERDWFHRYLTNPFTYRPGTRMPSPFPGGQTLLANVLEGDAAKQSEAVWLFLEDGAKAAIPPGIIKNAIPLVPGKEAIIYRNFIQGAGSRAIAVGYPEKAHLAFDGNQLRLALIWQGAFIDASKHWTDRGVGYQVPLGDGVVTLPAGPAFARLTSEADAWPKDTDKDKDHFRGYRLTKDQRPTFVYQLGDVTIEDFPNAVAGDKLPGLKRELTLTTKEAVNNLYFRAAVADAIEPLKDGWFAMGKEYRVRLPGGIVRDSGGKKELILPVKFKDGKATLLEEFGW